MRVRVRYDMPDEKQETRRERNDRFGTSSPAVNVPHDGWYLWQWYWSLSARLRRVRDGICEPVPPSEFIAWCQASGTIIYPCEYDILSAMDEAFCDEMNKELQDYRARQEEERKQELNAARKRR